MKDAAGVDSIRVALDLDAGTIEAARRLGNGDLSQGFRLAVELALRKLDEPTVPLRAAVKALTLKTIVPMIMEREACSADQALKRFHESHTGSCFADDETGLYGQGALHVFSLYAEEREK
jgi:hypothetical protein